MVLGCDGPYFKIPKEPDSSPPILTITNPADREIVSGEITINVYAFDNDELELVELFLNEESVLSSNEGPFEYQWATTEFPEDKYHSIQAKAIDITGNFNETRKIQVFVDNIENPDLASPQGTIVNPVNGQTVTDTVYWIIEASDNDSIAFTIFYIDGDSIFIDNEKPYEYEWITNTVSDQNYGLSAKVFDNSGNSVILGPITVIVDNIPEPDTTPPLGNITYPPASSTVSGNISIKVSAFDNEAVNHVQFNINGIDRSIDNSDPYEYNWDTSLEIDKQNYFISANISDEAGNITILSTISVFVNNSGDGEGPIVNITSPASNQTVSGEVEISASAYDESGIMRVEFHQNGNIAATDTEYPYAYTWNTIAEIDDTNHIWSAVAFDSNEYSTQSQSIILYVDNNDNIYPTGTIQYPYAGQHVSGEIEIQVSASDNQGISSVDFVIESITGITIVQSSDTSDPYSYIWNTTDASEDQQHFIKVTITDLSENITVLTRLPVVVDNDEDTDTTPPIVSILYPISGQSVNGAVIISAFASDNIGVSEVKFLIDNSLVSTITETPYEYSWDTSSLTNGTEYVIAVVAEDEAGNETNAQPIAVTIQN